LKYEFLWTPEKNQVSLKLEGESNIHLHLLLPDKKKAVTLKLSGTGIPFQNVRVEKSGYIDAVFTLNGSKSLWIQYE